MSTPADLVAQIHDLVERLLDLDSSACSDTDRQHYVLAVQRERDRLAVAAADTLAPWEASRAWQVDGTLRASLAMGRESRCDHRVAANELRRARLLAQMPHTRAAVVAGRLSMDHVDLFVRICGGVRFELFLEHEATLVEQLAGLPLFDDARRAVQYWALLADDLLGRRRERPEGSRVYLDRSSITGQAHLGGQLEAVDAEIVERELSRLMREVLLDDRANKVCRSTAQRRAVALVRMASRSVNASGPSARPLFEVVVGDETARRLCELASGVVVAPEALAAHIDTAVMQAFLFDGSNTVVAVSARRTFTGALRKAIQVRDRRCQHGSVCPVPGIDGDVDHRIPAARGGPTSQFNGRCLCWSHNRHEHLSDHPSRVPERHLTVLDEIRCRIRWQYLREVAPSDLCRQGDVEQL